MRNLRIKPHQLVLAGGVAFAAITVASGIASAVFEFEGDSAVHRTVFANIPDGYKVIFYTVTPLLLVYGAWVFSLRVRNWERGQPDRRELRRDNAHRRARDWRSGVTMQTLLRDPAAGIMHSLMYYGFFLLLGITTTLEIDHQLPEDLKFLHGGTYQGFAIVGDVAGAMFLAGVTWAIVRRYIQRPYRIRIKTRPEHAVILGVLFAIGITGFATEVFRIAEEGRPKFEQWSIIGYPLSDLVDGIDAIAGWHQAIWITHVLTFFVFLLILPITMMRHMFTSPLNMYLKDKDRPKGAMRAMPDLMETELETFGASQISDFTWKQLLDTDACTMCGRCTSVCPAHATGKPLDPREIVLKVGEVMAASSEHGVMSPPIGVDIDIVVSSDNVFERITTEELWACTSCRACDEICPVNIEILDKILDMRRYLTLMESDFPNELGSAFRGMENNANPWNMNNAERGDWAINIDGVEIVDPSDVFKHEYLYWVGCAGSFDDKNRRVSEATAKLLNRAGVDFAILGPSEMCTGDSARRSGNEYLWQMLAAQNIEAMNGMGVTKIITQCPHCFNTLKNEYPQVGGNYEVIHHSQFLEALIESGQLDMSEARLDERIVFHDSCYLGRHNDVYLPPRRVIGSLAGVEIVEAPRNGTKAMCCGAGGARMWMEENTGTKINDERSRELLDTGASRVATACPFCFIMIDDGVKAQGIEEDQVKVADISIHLLEALERGDLVADPVPSPGDLVVDDRFSSRSSRDSD